ncbi:hypothetical protein [Saccharicrinis sp. FJH54]|uniref:hypothetical protein n=1 Tax=Saccharicrinis sp. FJH54 TaxID=3344665 RepID=UPI0035D504F0
MKNTALLFIIAGIMLNSCAGLLFDGYTLMNVESKPDSIWIKVNNDTSNWKRTPTFIEFNRHKTPLRITAKDDSVERNIKIHDDFDTKFNFDHLLIDLEKPGGKGYHILYKPEKHELNFLLSVPEGNLFYVYSGSDYKSFKGFLGLSLGLEYYFRDKQAVNAKVGVLGDFILPFPAPYDEYGPTQHVSAFFSDFTISRDLYRLHYGIGMHYFQSYFRRSEIVEIAPDLINYGYHIERQNSIGPALTGYYRMSPNFNIGLNYYPSMFNWDRHEFNVHYTHLLFLDLIFTINLSHSTRKFRIFRH